MTAQHWQVISAAVTARASDWFFQAMFVGAVSSIVSGAVAERIKLSSFLVFSLIFAALIYPIQGAWTLGWRLLKSNGL